MKIHCFQHVPFEGLGHIAYWLADKNHQLSYTCFFEDNYKLPEFQDIDMLLIMGGPMGVDDEELYPWLTIEKDFIQQAIQMQKKLLGICLGAQLIAACCGAVVTKARHKEIGWFPIFPTAETTHVPWFNQLLINHPHVFHWHGDQFEIPLGGINLASSAANNNQAFLFREWIIGLQFHSEVTAESIDDLLKHCGHEIIAGGDYVQSETMIRSSDVALHDVHHIIEHVLTYLLAYE